MVNTISCRRHKLKKTQLELADAMHVRPATINSIENGRTVPNLRLAVRLARYFNVTVDQLFTWEAEDELYGAEDDKVGNTIYAFEQ